MSAQWLRIPLAICPFKEYQALKMYVAVVTLVHLWYTLTPVPKPTYVVRCVIKLRYGHANCYYILYMYLITQKTIEA